MIIETLAVAATCVFLMYAGLRVRSGALTVALLVQFLANVWLLYEPLRKLNAANMALQPLIAVGHRVLAVMAAPKDVEDRPGARTLDGFRDRIVFDGVSVAYAGRTVVNQVSFEIRRGEVVALVGASGAGKTTLASLVPRFFDPDEGRVTIDGHDLRDVTLKSLRSQIGIVTQHTILFDDTIRNNIAYANPEAPLAAVERAATAAYALDIVRAKPGEYDAQIGESGLRLSGGERQRIAIARALLKNAPILVLDEATSQLDSEAEAIVHRALQNLMEGRTVLIVAHHLATIQQADRIVVLDQGTVVATGRHEDLLGGCPTYRRLFEYWMATDHADDRIDRPDSAGHLRRSRPAATALSCGCGSTGTPASSLTLSARTSFGGWWPRWPRRPARARFPPNGGVLSGRAAIWRHEIPSIGSVVIKEYRRGGMLRFIRRRHYVRFRDRRVRSASSTISGPRVPQD